MYVTAKMSIHIVMTYCHVVFSVVSTEGTSLGMVVCCRLHTVQSESLLLLQNNPVKSIFSKHLFHFKSFTVNSLTHCSRLENPKRVLWKS